MAFTVSVMRTREELRQVQVLRQAAYGHHLPAQAVDFGVPDPMDLRPDVIIFVAKDKSTGAVVGSCRIQHNVDAPLLIESAITLDDEYQSQVLSEITRLVVAPGYHDARVRMALVKCCHLHNVARQICGIIAGSRPSLVRIYRSLGFVDLRADGALVPLPYAGNIPHRVLWHNSVTTEADWRRTGNPAHRFLFGAWHPDIRVFDALQESSFQHSDWGGLGDQAD